MENWVLVVIMFDNSLNNYVYYNFIKDIYFMVIVLVGLW